MLQPYAEIMRHLHDDVSLACMRVLMGLTDRRKTVKNLVDSRKN